MTQAVTTSEDESDVAVRPVEVLGGGVRCAEAQASCDSWRPGRL